MQYPTPIFLIHITLLLSNLLAGDATSPNTECVAELVADLVAFSPCFPFVAAPPNNFTTAVSPKCSDAITVLFTPTGNSSSCICYLLRHPQVFDFPLNVSRVLIIPSHFWRNTMRSLESTTVECSGEFVSELEEAIRGCSMVIIGSCVDKQEQCCWGLCEKHLPSKKTVECHNGSLLCHRHGIYQDKPAEFTGQSVSKLKEAIQKCDRVIKGGCTDEQCCWHLCKKQLQYAKTMDVSYKVVNGAHLCYCHAIYQGKPGPCAIMLNF